jgi:hypothetical protein
MHVPGLVETLIFLWLAGLLIYLVGRKERKGRTDAE